MTNQKVLLKVKNDFSKDRLVASVKELKVYFSGKRGLVHSVDGVSFDIRDGEMMGLVGETGCGKSVTARAFLQLVQSPPGFIAGGAISFSGKITCESCRGDGCSKCHNTGRTIKYCAGCHGSGCNLCNLTGQNQVDLLKVDNENIRKIRGNRVAMIFQDPGKALNPGLTIRTQLAEVFFQHRSNDIFEAAHLMSNSSFVTDVLFKRHLSEKSSFLEKLFLLIPPFRNKRKRISNVVDELIIKALAGTQIPNPRKILDRYPHELSGGMKQRVMIAQALSCNPDLLIADEPTTALDVTVQARILELIKELQGRRRTAVLYISHDLSLVRRVCDRVAVMYAGKIVETGDAETIFTNPMHPYTKGLIGALPSRKDKRGALAAIEGIVPELVEPKPGCRFASRCINKIKICENYDPSLQTVSEDHLVSCFLYHQEK